MNQEFTYLPINRLGELPDLPGVYVFRNNHRKLLYVGKAVSLKQRVAHHTKAPWFASARTVGYCVTNSDIEALVLEAHLIRTKKPLFNIVGKHTSRAVYVDFAHHLVCVVHTPTPFGPFVKRYEIYQALRSLRKLFPYYTAKHKKTPCMYCHLGLCPGPNPDMKEYEKSLRHLRSILKGHIGAVRASMQRSMRQASSAHNFERAARLRDTLKALDTLTLYKRMNQTAALHVGASEALAKVLRMPVPSRIETYDISNLQGKHAVGSMVVFIDDKATPNNYRRFKIRLPARPNDTAMLQHMVKRRLKHSEWPLPDLMLIDGGLGQLRAIQEMTSLKTIALAKRENILFTDNNKTIPLSSVDPVVSNLLLHMRDEAHRFAVAYHRRLRRKTIY